MATSTITSVQEALRELTSTSELLHVTHHRNKNQHRLAKWYKYISQLRRHVNKLIPELRSLETALNFASKEKGGKENKYVIAACERVDERVEFMREHLWERCYSAFSSVVADNQYAVLGLVLVAVLARVRSVLRPFGKATRNSDAEEIINETVAERSEEGFGMKQPRTDFGEVVKRDEIGKSIKANEMDEREDTSIKKSTTKRNSGLSSISDVAVVEITPAKRPKKKRKKGDAFDEIFDTII